MKVTFLVTDITAIGGVERVVFTLANYFTRIFNYDVTIISFYKCKNDKIYFDIDDRISIKYNNFNCNDKNTIKIMKKEFFEFRKLCKSIDSDILITLYTSHNIYASIIRKQLKYNIIACQHGQYYMDSPKLNLLKYVLYRNLETLIVLTSRDAEVYKRFCKNVEVIANPNPFDRNYLYNSNSKKILSIGRLDKLKSVEYSIKAFSLISSKYDEWILDITGEGEEKERLKNLVEELGLRERVIFTPFTREIIEKYSQAAFTVLTSQTEAFPMMLLESKCLGIPSISFDIRTGPREIIADKQDGYLVEKNNIKELAEYMDILISEKDKRYDMSQMAFENSKVYESSNICNIWKNKLEQIHSNNIK